MEQLLKQFEFTDPEIKVYKSLLKSGGAVISEIADVTKLKRTSCQEVVRSLEEKSFVFASKRGNKFFYQTEDPDKFVQIAKERQFTVDRLMLTLQAKTKRKRWSVRSITFGVVSRIIQRIKRKSGILCSFEHKKAIIYTIKDNRLILCGVDDENPAMEIISPELVAFHKELFKGN